VSQNIAKAFDRYTCFLLVALVTAATTVADEPAARPWIDPAGISGALLICGRPPAQAILDRFGELAGEDESHVMVVPGSEDSSPTVSEALPDAVVAHGSWSEKVRERLLAAVNEQPGRVGFCIDPAAAMVIRGRRIEVLEGPPVTVVLAASPGRPLREIELRPGARSDLTMLRRATLERSIGSFPSQALPPPHVEDGTLFIHGGGEMPPDVVRRFIELAGGPDAPIVVLPTAGEDPFPDDITRDTRVLTRAGATNVKSLRARLKSEVESPEFATAVNEARGVWFNGGRQWRFVDAYMGTKAEVLFRGVLRRGGVIGGSSAGASIQSQYMPRGSPLGNSEMMAEGYERGLGFLSGVAVDQHFTQRKRHADMTSLMRRYPQILGIGLDEGTAIVVQGQIAQVIGRGMVHFYDYRAGPPAGDKDYMQTAAGQKYDLAARKAMP
jgi:cyanophycinase